MRHRVVVASLFVAGLGMAPAAFAEELHGVISQHGSNGTLVVQADDASGVIVLLADNTKVRRLDGVRSTRVSAASLIPGLRVEVNGQYGNGNRFVAERDVQDIGHEDGSGDQADSAESTRASGQSAAHRRTSRGPAAAGTEDSTATPADRGQRRQDRRHHRNG
jgi:hypothetical protein